MWGKTLTKTHLVTRNEVFCVTQREERLSREGLCSSLHQKCKAEFFLHSHTVTIDQITGRW